MNQPVEWRWSSCGGYYGEEVYPMGMLDSEYILNLFSTGFTMDVEKFKEFNERKNNDRCLEASTKKNRLTDEEARLEIRSLLGTIAIAQVKSLPKEQRNTILQKVKRIDGLTLRQAARILGVSVSLIYRA